MKVCRFCSCAKNSPEQNQSPRIPVYVLRILSRAEFKRLGLSLPSFRLFLFSLHGGFIVVLPFFDFPEKALFLEPGFQHFQGPFNVVSLYLNLQKYYLLPLSGFLPPPKPLPPPPLLFAPPKPPPLLPKPLSLGCWGLASETESVLSIKALPFNASIALRASSADGISTKPNPRLFRFEGRLSALPIQSLQTPQKAL